MEWDRNRLKNRDGPTITPHNYIKTIASSMTSESHRIRLRRVHNVSTISKTECWGRVGGPDQRLPTDILKEDSHEN